MAYDASHENTLRDYLGAVFIAVLIALLIRFFVIEAYRIPSAAMKPTLVPGDTIFVTKLPFGIRLPWNNELLRPGRTPRYGEVVVFSHPDEPGRDFIKRVVGLPGDTVAIRKGQVILNNKNLSTDPKRKDVCGVEKLPNLAVYGTCAEAPVMDDYGPVQVPQDQVFVLGDLRNQVPDPKKAPKNWGLIPVSDIKGLAKWIWLSIEPQALGPKSSWFKRIRFDRMFVPID